MSRLNSHVTRLICMFATLGTANASYAEEAAAPKPLPIPFNINAGALSAAVPIPFTTDIFNASQINAPRVNTPASTGNIIFDPNQPIDKRGRIQIAFPALGSQLHLECEIGVYMSIRYSLEPMSSGTLKRVGTIRLPGKNSYYFVLDIPNSQPPVDTSLVFQADDNEQTQWSVQNCIVTPQN